ncbi:MAG: TolC family protein [Planctomycetaceae bacterium]|nr:TolC family protein [Planctomycetaceae bacterium]
MRGHCRNYAGLVVALPLALSLAAAVPGARAEDLAEAWAIALDANPQLRASRQTTTAAGLDLASSRSERLPQIQTLNLESFLTNPISVPGLSGQPQPARRGQEAFTISGVAAILPLYTGGRIRNTIEGNRAQLGAARADEVAEVLDLKLDVARAYVDVLRADRGVAVARSSVTSLTAQARDVSNLVRQGLGIRNDLLAAQVARANAQQREIQSRNRLSIAWAAYNRYLCRPMETVVPLADLVQEPPSPAGGEPTSDALSMEDSGPIVPDEAQIRALGDRALVSRPELASLSEQARAQQAQAATERAKTRPQVSFVVANIYQNARFLPTEADTGAAAFVLNWTLFDGGRARRHSAAIEHRGAAQLSRRDDLASAIRLQVRSAWLTCRESERRIPVARAAIVQAEENLRVARGRYLQQRGTNTEVLDAEAARVQSYDNYFNALYDAIVASFELRRAVGDI